MARPSFGHVSRKCVRCGGVGPRTSVDGGWAHSRCITPEERREAHRRVLDARAPRNAADDPASRFMRLASTVTPDAVGTALGVRGDAKVRIDSLRVAEGSRRLGLAEQALRGLCGLADETDVTLTAEVWPREQGDEAITQDALDALFARHGFAPTGIGHTMRREPRGA